MLRKFLRLSACIPLRTQRLKSILQKNRDLNSRYYSQKGYNLKGELNLKGLEFLGANASAQLQSQYIDIPLLLKADLGGFEIFAGPQVSYLTKADVVLKAGVLGFNLLNKKMDATEQFNR